MRYDFFDISQERYTEWADLCPVNEYRVISPAALPGIVPAGLLAKTNSVLVMGSASPHGVVYYMANLNRVDLPAQAIDQQPFGLAFVGTSPAGSACLVQHGNWPGRTSHPTADFWAEVHASRLSAYYPLAELPAIPSGPLSSLLPSSQGSAFRTVVAQLQRFIVPPEGQD